MRASERAHTHTHTLTHTHTHSFHPFSTKHSNVTHLSVTWMLTGIAAMGALRQRGMYASLISDLTIVPILLGLTILGLFIGTCTF